MIQEVGGVCTQASYQKQASLVSGTTPAKNKKSLDGKAGNTGAECKMRLER